MRGVVFDAHGDGPPGKPSGQTHKRGIEDGNDENHDGHEQEGPIYAEMGCSHGRNGRKKKTNKETSCVTHKNFCWLEVKNKEAQNGADKGRQKQDWRFVVKDEEK